MNSLQSDTHSQHCTVCKVKFDSFVSPCLSMRHLFCTDCLAAKDEHHRRYKKLQKQVQATLNIEDAKRLQAMCQEHYHRFYSNIDSQQSHAYHEGYRHSLIEKVQEYVKDSEAMVYARRTYNVVRRRNNPNYRALSGKRDYLKVKALKDRFNQLEQAMKETLSCWMKEEYVYYKVIDTLTLLIKSCQYHIDFGLKVKIDYKVYHDMLDTVQRLEHFYSDLLYAEV